MTTVTALPSPVPSSSSPATFNADADAFLGALPTFRTEINLVAGEVNTNAGSASTNAASALASKLEAAASAASALGASGATKWLVGTSYSEGNTIWSPSNYQTYRRTSTGAPAAGGSDPGIDPTTWWVPLTVTVPSFVLLNAGVI